MVIPQPFCLRVLISGKVQGVGYRFWTVRQARNLDLRGWVRNLSDGRVEAVFSGDRRVVEQMLELCYQGPSAAVVKEVIAESSDVGDFEGFEVR
jgi:acylphosphatase